MNNNLTIGKLAKEAGVGVETIRYYERRGLISQPPRADHGYRRYPLDTVRLIRFIRRAKKLGFTLKEIGELRDLRCVPGVTCDDIRQRAQIKLADIRARIEELEKMSRILSELTESCSFDKGIGECPILNMIDGQSCLKEEKL